MDREKDLQDRLDDATDNATLDEIEENESVGDSGSDSPAPEPDEGLGRDDDSGLDDLI